jgi:hypothetical protein
VAYHWDGASTLAYGCPFGGTIRYASYGNGSRLTLRHCEFTAGGAATGTGTIDDVHGTFRLHLAFSDAWAGTVTYVRHGNGHRTVTSRLHFHRA